MSNVNFRRLRKYLIAMFIVLCALVIGEAIYLNIFNKRAHSQVGPVTDSPVTMSIAGRGDSTSIWQKRDFDWNGSIVDLNAQTIDGTIVNASNYNIREWQMRINFNDDCFFNSAWCGTVEIHQDVYGDERVQTLDLRDYDLDAVELDYYYDGDLLIPLFKGDYVIYYPSIKDKEITIDKKSQLTMGFIVYFLDFPDLTDYEITYYYNRHLKDGYMIYVIIMLAIIWLLLVIISAVSYIAYKTATKEMEIKKSGILSMSDMYSVIYILDLVKNELVPVAEDEGTEKRRQNHLPADEQLKGLFESDCEDAYKELTAEMCDFDTIKSRLENRNTFAFEYVSKTHGWSRIRFFAMQEVAGKPFERVVFTVQDVNDEKAGMEEIQNRIDTAEHESKSKSIFLANMSHEIRTPINTVIGFDTMILREAKDPAIRSYARNINSAANMLLSLINGILDISKLEADKMELVTGEYSFKQMIIEVVNMIKSRPEFDRLDFVCDVSPRIADRLYGDSVRLKQVILNLISNAAKYTDKGSVKLSVFGSEHDGMMHLLISVKDTGTGIKEEDLNKIAKRFQRFDSSRNHTIEGTGIGLNLVSKILDLMDSELHVISKYGEGSEFYFELEQKIADSEPVGKIEFTDDITDDEYHAMFVAPDASVLVVDDNAMNIEVFTDLLKETKLNIDSALSGAKALEMTGSKKYDLIFMDHMMPEMDGIETFRRIRKNKKGPNADTPVIMLTANALKGAKEEYEKEGFCDFMAKPIQPEWLERITMKHLDPAKVDTNTAAAEKQERELSIPEIMGVDVAYGVSHAGGVTNYMSLLDKFIAAADGDIDEIKSYIDIIKSDRDNKEALENFALKIHSVKEFVNVIGALEVFGIASALEKFAARDDIDGILNMAPYFCDELRALSGNIKKVK